MSSSAAGVLCAHPCRGRVAQPHSEQCTTLPLGLLPTPAGNTLRQLVFDCVCEGRLWALPAGSPHKQPTPKRKLLASTAAFAASGIIHESIFW